MKTDEYGGHSTFNNETEKKQRKVDWVMAILVGCLIVLTFLWIGRLLGCNTSTPCLL